MYPIASLFISYLRHNKIHKLSKKKRRSKIRKGKGGVQIRRRPNRNYGRVRLVASESVGLLTCRFRCPIPHHRHLVYPTKTLKRKNDKNENFHKFSKENSRPISPDSCHRLGPSAVRCLGHVLEKEEEQRLGRLTRNTVACSIDGSGGCHWAVNRSHSRGCSGSRGFQTSDGGRRRDGTRSGIRA